MNCPLCNNSKIKKVYQNKNMPLGVNLKNEIINLSISLCENCSFVFQDSAFSNSYDEQINKLYKSYTISSMYDFPNRNKQHLKALDFISEVIVNEQSFNVLEIGSNRGDFLYLLKEKFKNINILGFEPTTFDNLKVPTINAFFDESLLNTKFNLIILRHTLEHIKYPQNFIKKVIKLLDDSGKIFIEVPNIDYSLKEKIEDFTPDHVNFFSSTTLNNVMGSMNCFKYEDNTFLYMLFNKNTALYKNDFFVNDNYEKSFNQFTEKIYEAKRMCQNYDRIIFYGVSNSYLWTYTKFKEDLIGKEVGFFDDFIKEDNVFGLKLIEKFEPNDLIILCSSNKDIQDKMISKLPNNINILKLFKGKVNV